MTRTETAPAGRLAQVKRTDPYAAQIRMLAVLILAFAVIPGALLLSVGVLVLVLGSHVRDTVFGVLILALAATLIAGITATVLYVRRGTSLARLQGEFVRNVSHDLRTPLTSIKMFVETLRDGRVSDPARTRECLDILSRETDRLTGLVERLLKWAQMEAGNRIYRLVPAQAGAIIDRAVETLDGQIKLRQLENQVQLRRDRAFDSALLEADPDALAEALLNVLQNALLYTGNDKQISISSTPRDKGLLISIADNGPGIPKPEQGRIFEKFHRAVDPARPDVKGTGLGLAMVHHIVRAHRGRITVQSEVGRGATFHIWLPVEIPTGPEGVGNASGNGSA